MSWILSLFERGQRELTSVVRPEYEGQSVHRKLNACPKLTMFRLTIETQKRLAYPAPPLPDLSLGPNLALLEHPHHHKPLGVPNSSLERVLSGVPRAPYGPSTGSMEPQPHRKRRRTKPSDERDSPPENFLFVDSSDQQGTSKPDRASRSFVMQQARKQKTWSTKKFPSHSLANRSAKARGKDSGSAGEGASLSWVHYDPKNEGSHKKERIVTPRRSPVGHHLPNTACRISFCNGDFCSQSHAQNAHALSLKKRSRPTLSPIGAGVFDPFNILPVRADHRAYTLLDHCKPE